MFASETISGIRLSSGNLNSSIAFRTIVMFRLSTSCRIAEAQTPRPCIMATRRRRRGTICDQPTLKHERCTLKLSREPLLLFEFEETLLALRYAKPLFALPLFPDRKTTRPHRGHPPYFDCKGTVNFQNGAFICKIFSKSSR